jgi:hypothetical protein
MMSHILQFLNHMFSALHPSVATRWAEPPPLLSIFLVDGVDRWLPKTAGCSFSTVAVTFESRSGQAQKAYGMARQRTRWWNLQREAARRFQLRGTLSIIECEFVTGKQMHTFKMDTAYIPNAPIHSATPSKTAPQSKQVLLSTHQGKNDGQEFRENRVTLLTQ